MYGEVLIFATEALSKMLLITAPTGSLTGNESPNIRLHWHLSSTSRTKNVLEATSSSYKKPPNSPSILRNTENCCEEDVTGDQGTVWGQETWAELLEGVRRVQGGALCTHSSCESFPCSSLLHLSSYLLPPTQKVVGLFAPRQTERHSNSIGTAVKTGGSIPRCPKGTELEFQAPKAGSKPAKPESPKLSCLQPLVCFSSSWGHTCWQDSEELLWCG